MEASNLQIYWHESQPIYSLCFQPSAPNGPKLITGGGDNKVRVWHLNFDETHKAKIETIDFLSSLNQHEQAINVVRFNYTGDILASAGDDGQLLLWKQSDKHEKQFGEEDAEFQESWSVWKRFRPRGSGIGAYEIYDIAWSPNNDYIVTGSMDNTIRIFQISSGDCVATASTHSHYVQGVVWDPLNKYILSQSADRSVFVHEIIWDDEEKELEGLKTKNKMMKCELPVSQKDSKKLDIKNTKLSFLFHNETLPSFFRRPAMSPCGSVICLPAGIFKSDSTQEGVNNLEMNNAVHVYTRSSIIRNINKPTMCIPFLKKPAIVVSFNPNFYKLTENTTSYLRLPYRLVFAVATSNEALIYDTEKPTPIAIIGNLHYTSLTDLSWSQDGTLLMVSSTDGFCSYISIAEDTLGEKIDKEHALTLLNRGSDGPSKDLKENTTSLPSKSDSPLKQKEKEIMNILPVKRKLPAHNQISTGDFSKSNGSDIENGNTENPIKQAKGKRRITPTVVKPE